MMDALVSMTALPNLHPALVHFPIALAAVALLFDALLLAAPRRAPFDRSAALLWVLAALGAAATYAAGRDAADGLGPLPRASELALGAHADAAWVAGIAIGLIAALRAALAWRDWNQATPRRDPARWTALIAGLALQALLLHTADLGGALVYQHGLAVADRVTEAAGDPAASARPAAAGSGVVVHVADRARLVLSSHPRRERLTARLDTSRFEGRVSLVVHSGQADAIRLRVASPGDVALIRSRGPADEILDQASGSKPDAVWSLSLVAAAGHIKGYIDAKLLVHGHASVPNATQIALEFEGRGDVRVLAFGLATGAATEAEATSPEPTGADGHEHEHGHEHGHEH